MTTKHTLPEFFSCDAFKFPQKQFFSPFILLYKSVYSNTILNRHITQVNFCLFGRIFAFFYLK